MTTSRSTPSTARKFLHIAAGALRNPRGEVLICQRPTHKIYPGEWEFPGGKVEPGERVEAALARELREELGVAVTAARPLIRLRYEYPELAVDLDTWLVSGWHGTPASNEHPQSAWVMPDELPRWPLLAADQPIVRALRLPAQYVFTPPSVDESRFGRQLDALPADALVRLRLPQLDDARYRAFVERWSVDVQWERPLILDRDPRDVAAFGADGFHATAAVLATLAARPVPPDKWFGASCHDAADLARAHALGADYAVLGPVQATATHPGAPVLGWEGFARLALHAGMPVYAIGGVGPGDLAKAWRHGAQGVAGIGAYWRDGGSDASGAASPLSSAGIE